MTARTRWILTAAVLALVALGGWRLSVVRGARPPGETARASQLAEPPPEVGVVRFTDESLELAGLTVEPLMPRTLQRHLALTGEVLPDVAREVQITPRVAGKIIRLHVTIGDRVRAGQTLAVLDSTELATVQAEHRQALARLQAARQSLAAQEELAGLGQFTQPRLQSAQQQAVAARRDVSEARQTLAAAENALSAARSARDTLMAERRSATQGVVTAQATVREREAEMATKQAAVRQAQAQVEVTVSRFRRLDILFQEELVSRQDWENARAEQAKARADESAATAGVSQSRARIAAAEGGAASAVAALSAADSRIDGQESLVKVQAAQRDRAAASLASAGHSLTIFEEALKREEQVFEKKLYASQPLVEARAAVRGAEIARDAAADTVRILGARPGGGNLLHVRAPAAGVVTVRSASLGETVSPEKTLFTVLNVESVWVWLNVYQRDLPHVRVGQGVEVTTNAAPGQTFRGSVSYISELVDEKTRTVKVRCVIPNPKRHLKPGMFVEGRLLVETREGALAVPRDAVQDLNGAKVVFVAGERPTEFHAVKVEVDDSFEGWTILLSGVDRGARVVIDGAFIVKSEAIKSELGED